jgi:hypothetical protein
MTNNPQTPITNDLTFKTESKSTVLIVDEILHQPFIFKSFQEALKNKIPTETFLADLKLCVLQNDRLSVAFSNKNKDFDTFKTFFLSLLKCAGDGLLPNGKEAYLSVYDTFDKEKNKKIPTITYIPMKYGLLKAACRNGFSLEAEIVYKDDEFTIGRNEMQQRVFMHTPNIDGIESMGDNNFRYDSGSKKQVGEFTLKASDVFERIRGAYALAIDLKNQRYVRGEWMSIGEIKRIFNNPNMVRTKKAWNDMPLRMIIKTVIHRLANETPQIFPDNYLIQEVEDSNLILQNPEFESQLDSIIKTKLLSVSAVAQPLNLSSMFDNKQDDDAIVPTDINNAEETTENMPSDEEINNWYEDIENIGIEKADKEVAND